jgi:hypothetical protein
MDHTLRGPEVADSPMVDNSDQPSQLRACPDDGGHVGEAGTMDHHAERRPYAVRVRMIMLLSLISWAMLIAALAWIFD